MRGREESIRLRTSRGRRWHPPGPGLPEVQAGRTRSGPSPPSTGTSVWGRWWRTGRADGLRRHRAGSVPSKGGLQRGGERREGQARESRPGRQHCVGRRRRGIECFTASVSNFLFFRQHSGAAAAVVVVATHLSFCRRDRDGFERRARGVEEREDGVRVSRERRLLPLLEPDPCLISSDIYSEAAVSLNSKESGPGLSCRSIYVYVYICSVCGFDGWRWRRGRRAYI